MSDKLPMTREQIQKLFTYRDGKLYRLKRTSNRIRIGQEVGSPRADGYRSVKINGADYLVHRIIWLWHFGYLPENGLDHINRKRSDDRIENLREVSQVCNLRNTANSKANTSGVKGVSYNKKNGKWSAYIRVLRKHIHLGEYFDFNEAVCHRLAAEQSLGWEGCDSCSPAFQYIKKNITKQACAT